jgi:hypothetical protein
MGKRVKFGHAKRKDSGLPYLTGPAEGRTRIDAHAGGR